MPIPKSDQTTGIPVVYEGETFFRCRRCEHFELATQDELHFGTCERCDREKETRDEQICAATARMGARPRTGCACASGRLRR